MLERLLTEHLNRSHNPLHLMQFGFRTHHSTEGAISVFSEKENKKKTTKSFLDKVVLEPDSWTPKKGF